MAAYEHIALNAVALGTGRLRAGAADRPCLVRRAVRHRCALRRALFARLQCRQYGRGGRFRRRDGAVRLHAGAQPAISEGPGAHAAADECGLRAGAVAAAADLDVARHEGRLRGAFRRRAWAAPPSGLVLLALWPASDVRPRLRGVATAIALVGLAAISHRGRVGASELPGLRGQRSLGAAGSRSRRPRMHGGSNPPIWSRATRAIRASQFVHAVALMQAGDRAGAEKALRAGLAEDTPVATGRHRRRARRAHACGSGARPDRSRPRGRGQGSRETGLRPEPAISCAPRSTSRSSARTDRGAPLHSRHVLQATLTHVECRP